MLDVTEQLERYASALGDAVPEETAFPHRRSSRRFALAAAAVAVVALGAWVLIQTTSEERDTSLATESGQQRLPVPDQGASPELLDDGTPVWVVRQDDGTVSVLDAVSSHRALGAGTLVGWCEASSGFEDPMYGTLYDAQGRYRGGPAPTGLPVYEVAELSDGTVTVTGPARSQPRQAEGGPTSSPSGGKNCFAGDGDYVPGYNPGSLVLHPVGFQEPMPPAEAIADHEGAVVVVEAPIVLIQGRGPVVCTMGVDYSAPPQCEGIPAPGLELPGDESWALLNGPFIARPVDGALTDVAYVGERRIEWSERAASQGVIYLIDGDEYDTLTPVAVDLPGGGDRLQSTLDALFATPPVDHGYVTAIPLSSELVAVTVDDANSTAIISTTGLFGEQGIQGGALVRALAQIVWTATEHPGVREVVLLDDGERRQALIDGLESVNRPVTRADYDLVG